MEAIVSKDQFLNALELAKPGLAVKEVLEQSLCFVLKDGLIISYNDETSVRVPSGLPKEILGAVLANPLLEALRKVEADHLRVAVDEEAISLSWKRATITQALESDIRLPVNAVKPPGAWKALHKDFAEAVHLVQQCVGKDETKTALVCIYVTEGHVEGSDGYQACKWKLKTGVSEPMLLRKSSVSTLSTLGVTEISEGNEWVHFKSPRGAVLSCRRYQEEYPSEKHAPYFLQEGVRVQLPEKIKEACELADVYSKEHADHNLVRVDLKPGSPGKVIVTGEGLTGKVKQVMACNWSGEPVSFMIAPQVLTEIVGQHKEVQINDDIIKADGGSFVYVSMLSRPEEWEEYVGQGKKKKSKSKESSDE